MLCQGITGKGIQCKNQATSCKNKHPGKITATPAYTKEHRAKSVNKKRELITKAKSVPCHDCGNNFPTCSMDFDHKKDKLFNIGQSISSKSLKKISKEIAKCDVVCSNCHRVRTNNRKKIPIIRWWPQTGQLRLLE